MIGNPVAPRQGFLFPVRIGPARAPAGGSRRLRRVPKRADLKSILVLGSGPIIIGQACEFDYSGTQACRVLRKEGFRVVLVNSNPATIMTDPEFADATYIEPLDVATVEKVIARERPDALLPTVGGQTALNLAVALDKAGVLARYGVELLGASAHSVELGEDRLLFKEAMQKAGVDVLRSGMARTVDEAREIAHPFGFPVVVRPSYTLGGTGGGIAFNADDFQAIVKRGLLLSPVNEMRHAAERLCKGVPSPERLPRIVPSQISGSLSNHQPRVNVACHS